MSERFISIWFRHLLTDWLIRRQPDLKDIPFVISAKEGARTIISAASIVAEESGIYVGMALADAKAINPKIEVFENKPGLIENILDLIAAWCTRYTPSVTLNAPDGLTLDISGCAHLFGGEREMLKNLVTALRGFGYDARAAIADTIGAAWAFSRYGLKNPILLPGEQRSRLANLPPSALRLEQHIADNLRKVGIRKVGDLYKIPRPNISRRFGKELILRLDQALGERQEKTAPKEYVAPYQEKLVSFEGIASPENIAAAVKIILKKICSRLIEENKGIRLARLDCLRIDGVTETVNIGTSRPSNDPVHLFRLFEEKLGLIEPAFGIELFTLDVGQVEDIQLHQQEIPNDAVAFNSEAVPGFVDRISNRFSQDAAYRLIRQESYWPERFAKRSISLNEKSHNDWDQCHLRPIRLLSPPAKIEVTAPVPDYPPLFFKYKGNLLRVVKADGPERIEREWWIKKGDIRDYYVLEVETGERYWIFRSGHFNPSKQTDWFLHGFFS